MDVGVELASVEVKTASNGVLGLFKKKSGSKESSLSIKLATRVIVTKPG